MNLQNSVFSIQLYKKHGCWVFDDELRGLVAEPFVLGATELISYHLKLKGVRKRKPVIQFSLTEIPNAEIVLTCTKKHLNPVTGEATSGDYVDQHNNKCWLCPAQVKFFGVVADTIYAVTP